MKNAEQSNTLKQKPTHIEFLNSSQFSIHPENTQGYTKLYIKCQLSPHQAQIVKNASQDYTVMFTNLDKIVFPPAIQSGIVEIVDGVAVLVNGSAD